MPAIKPLSRRNALEWIGGAIGAAFVAGCGSSGSGSDISSSGSSSSGSSGTSGSCTSTDELTSGPYPGDGSNTDDNGTTIDVLSDAGIIRSDITSDIGGTNTQSGIPLALSISLENLNSSCTALSGYYIYIWHCNKDGDYSAYTASTNNSGYDYEGTTFLRGVQQTDSSGQVSFTTIFPGRYTGRVNHIHMEIYSSSSFTSANKVLTTQFCFPDSTDTTADGYYLNTNSSSLTNASDQVFSSDYASMMFTISGDTSGYTASLTVGIAV